MATTNEIKKAYDILSCDDGDSGITKMIESIKNHPNQNELIDYVDGVDVWEKLEHELTCKEFINLISE